MQQSGRQFISTDISGAVGIIEHGYSGLLVTPGDVDDLASFIKSLLYIDLFFILSASARRRVEKVFKIDYIIGD